MLHSVSSDKNFRLRVLNVPFCMIHGVALSCAFNDHNRSGEILRLRERKRPSDPAGDADRLGLRDARRDSPPPSCKGDALRLLLRADGLVRALRELRLPSRLVLRLRPLIFSSSLPSMAERSRLLRGASSPFSSRTSRFDIRGRMRSHTRSSFSN